MKADQEFSYDVVVIGGGLSGCSAAIAARRNGASVLMVERLPFAGGAWTGGMVTHVAGLIDHDRIYEEGEEALNPRKWIVQGLACDFHDRLAEFGAAKGIHWDHESGKMILDQILEEEGVDVLYGTQFFRAVTKDARIEAVELIYRTTSIRVKGRVFIDSSGDGDLGSSAGCSFYFGRESDGRMSPATLSYMIGGIDRSLLYSERDYGVPIGGHETQRAPEEAGNRGEDLNEIVKKALADGLLPADMRPAAICLKYAEGCERDELWCSFVRQWGNITDPQDYSRMERDGRKVGWEIFRYLKQNSKSCRDAYLSGLGTQIWPRECRHFKTLYTVCAEDFRSQARFPDAVARAGFYLDIHSVQPGTSGFDLDERHPVRDRFFDIPYRSLLPENRDNLLFAGRTIGADHEGHSAIRVMGTGIATGQAAGTAAALALRSGVARMAELDVSNLQAVLRRQGVVI